MLFVAIAFFSPLQVVAVPESVIAGPYIVSFDIGEPLNEHDIFTKGPEETEELSGVKRHRLWCEHNKKFQCVIR
jgi:hypothetical protein